jgi:hypothetical protein
MPNSARIGSWLGRHVVDVDGREIGRVHDVRLERDGPIIPGFGAALRVSGLIVGRGSIAQRLGFDRVDITGPWPLDVWGKRAARRARFVPWALVEERADTFVCAKRADELEGANP